MHAGEFAVVGLGDVDVEGLALVDEGSSVRCHLQDGFLGDLPHRLVELLQVLRNLGDVLERKVFQCSATIFTFILMKSISSNCWNLSNPN